jgi:hypothetical protein
MFVDKKYAVLPLPYFLNIQTEGRIRLPSAQVHQFLNIKLQFYSGVLHN